MTETSLPPDFDPRNPEDYTGSVSWLLPKGCYTIVDIDDIPLMLAHDWRIYLLSNGTTPRVLRPRGKGQSGLVLLHRELLGFPEGLLVDHRNRVPIDNRRCNLRPCTHRENVLNSSGQSGSASRFKGVSICRRTNEWRVWVSTPTGRRYLGSFDDEEAAARVYNEFARAHYGPFALLNAV